MVKNDKRNYLRDENSLEIIFPMTIKEIANLETPIKEEVIDMVFGDVIELKEDFSRDLYEEFENKQIEKTRQEKTEIESELKECNTYLNAMQEEYEKAKEEYEKALKKMTEARTELFNAKEKYGRLQENYSIVCESLRVGQRIKDDMKKIVLVHSSASLKQVYLYRMSEIVVNDCDADYFERALLDKICDTSKLTNLIKVLPENLKDNYSDDTESVVKYCELVANMLTSIDEPNMSIVLLFNSFEISKILKMNGIV